MLKRRTSPGRKAWETSSHSDDNEGLTDGAGRDVGTRWGHNPQSSKAGTAFPETQKMRGKPADDRKRGGISAVDVDAPGSPRKEMVMSQVTC